MGEIIDFESAKWRVKESPDNVKTEGFYACMSVAETCVNPESNGAICLLCNMCGRFEETEE